MPAQPLVIDADPSDIRVVASQLELQNNKTVRDAFDHNVRLKEQKERQAAKVISDVAHDI